MPRPPVAVHRFAAALAVLALSAAAAPAADVAVAGFEIADGSLSLEAPAGFERVRPSSGMVETEFKIPSEGDSPAGRMTVMGAGGSIEANIDRWCGQFTQPDGGDTKAKVSRKQLKVAGCSVTLVDIPGTYLDKPGGPFAGGPTVERPGYRMLAAIIQTPEAGNYFLKFYGPSATVEKHADGFRTMIEGMVPARQAP
ncbi:MAG: hypothetical protein ACKOCX_03730 [Planctomycetota bacterium]